MFTTDQAIQLLPYIAWAVLFALGYIAGKQR